MFTLEIHLLGPPQVTLTGEPVLSMRSDKVLALLTYLAVESERPHRREKLAGLLWPDYPESSARSSLRRALADLRKGIGDERAEQPYLLITRQTIQFNQESKAWVDVTAFTSHSQAKKQIDQVVIQGWREAVDMYRGEFMEGFSLPDSPAFEEWQLLNREHFRRQVLETFHRLCDALEAQGEIESALPYAWRQVEIEPSKENAHRQIMRLLALSGQRDAALTQYQTCSKILASELGVEPEVETTELCEAIKAGDLVSSKVAPQPGEPEAAPSPYRGLFAFREIDAPFFFGREEFVRQLIESTKQDSLVAVIGPSGSGKSSVVFAGMIPHIRQVEGWEIAAFRPGIDPFQALAATLLPLLEPEFSETDRLVETRKLASALTEGELPLMDVATRILAINPRADHLLLVVDQFEELYTLCSKSGIRTRFIDVILDSVCMGELKKESQLHVVLTLRADFLGSALMHRPFADALQRSDIKLGSMTREEMTRAIQIPAQIQAVQFEPGLVERILDEVADEPGDLPLLQFALANLWDLQNEGQLTHEAYEEIDCVEGALARYADDFYTGLDTAKQKTTRRIFMQLVQPGEGTEDTRRLATKAELGQDNWEMTQELADARLVVTNQSVEGGETVEVVHEALIKGWGKLRDWVDEDRAFRTWQEGLRVSIRKWEATEGDEGAHLRGIPLAEAESWFAERGQDLSPSELEFIQASLDSRNRRQEERYRLRRRITIGLSVGLVVTLILAVFAGLQWRQADLQRNSAIQAQATAAAERDQTQSALSGLLAAQARNLLDEQYDLALLLDVESVRRVDTIEGRASLYAALNHSPSLSHFLHGHQNDIRSVAFHPNGSLLASGDMDGKIFLWDAEVRLPLGEPLGEHQGPVNSLRFNPDGSLLASASFDHTIILWDGDQNSPSFGQPVGSPLSAHTGNVWSVAFSPDGLILASAGAEGEIILWDVAASSDSFGQMIAKLPDGHEGIVTSVAFSPDGAILASGGADKAVILWDVETGQPFAPTLNGHSAFVTSVAFSPDGRTLASGSKDNTILLWDVKQGSTSFGQPLGEPLTGHSDNVWGLAFSPEGDKLASGSEDGTLVLWDVDAASETFGQSLHPPLSGHAGPVYALVFSPEDERLVSVGGDQAVILWNIKPDNPVARELMRMTDSLWWVTFSPDGTRLAWSDPHGIIFLWDVDENSSSFGKSLGAPFVGHSDFVNNIAFSPVEKLMASGSDDSTIILWDVDEASSTFGQPLAPPLTGRTGEVYGLEFSPDGKILASGDENGHIRIWDVDRDSVTFGEQLGAPLEGQEGMVLNIQFSPDGKILISEGGYDGAIRLWDMEDGSASFGQQLGALLGDRVEIYAMKISPGGKMLASSGEDGLIRIWDIDRESASFGKQLGPPLTGYQYPIWVLDFSPDGKYLVSGDLTGAILLWELTSRKAMEISVPYEMGEVIGVYFNPNGTKLVAVFRDSRVVQWEMNLESWQSRACQRANRNLTLEEWQRFFGDEPYRPTCPDLPVEPAE